MEDSYVECVSESSFIDNAARLVSWCRPHCAVPTLSLSFRGVKRLIDRLIYSVRFNGFPAKDFGGFVLSMESWAKKTAAHRCVSCSIFDHLRKLPPLVVFRGFGTDRKSVLPLIGERKTQQSNKAIRHHEFLVCNRIRREFGFRLHHTGAWKMPKTVEFLLRGRSKFSCRISMLVEGGPDFRSRFWVAWAKPSRYPNARPRHGVNVNRRALYNYLAFLCDGVNFAKISSRFAGRQYRIASEFKKRAWLQPGTFPRV